MEANANVQAGTETATKATVTEMVVPIDLRQVSRLAELKIREQSQLARKSQIRQVGETALDEEWQNVTPLLTPHGDYAGGAQFAHAIVCDRLYQAREEEFDAIGNVTLRELWPIVHESLKKRGLVFNGGFVTGMRR